MRCGCLFVRGWASASATVERPTPAGSVGRHGAVRSITEALKRADAALLASSYQYQHPGRNAKENDAIPRGPAQTRKSPQGEDRMYNMQVSCVAGLYLLWRVLTLYL